MKLKYDYWEAAKYVMNRTFIGFLASVFLGAVGVFLLIAGVVALCQIFGIIGAILLGCLISISIIVIMTLVRIKKKGRYYANY